MKRLLTFAAVLAAIVSPQLLNATRLIGVKTIDKDYIMVHFRDGEVRYRDDATGPSAYLGQTPFNGTETWSPGNGGDARQDGPPCIPVWHQKVIPLSCGEAAAFQHEVVYRPAHIVCI